jgi:CubicO group peptidase (beta-lactamase class C family)
LNGLPGTKYEYNQTNYILLKRVIERVSHTPLRHFLCTRVFRSGPTAMPWGDSRTIIARRSEMYTALHGDTIENGGDLYQYPSYLEGAAGLNATVVEMERLGIALTDGSLLDSKELRALAQPVRQRDGSPIDLGLELKLDGELSPSLGMLYADNSSGSFPRLFMTGGSSTSIMFFPKQGLFIVVLTNLQAKDDPIGIAEGVAHFYIPSLTPMF